MGDLTGMGVRTPVRGTLRYGMHGACCNALNRGDTTNVIFVKLYYVTIRTCTTYIIETVQDNYVYNYCKKLNSLKHLVRTTVAE